MKCGGWGRGRSAWTSPQLSRPSYFAPVFSGSLPSLNSIGSIQYSPQCTPYAVRTDRMTASPWNIKMSTTCVHHILFRQMSVVLPVSSYFLQRESIVFNKGTGNGRRGWGKQQALSPVRLNQWHLIWCVPVQNPLAAMFNGCAQIFISHNPTLLFLPQSPLLIRAILFLTTSALASHTHSRHSALSQKRYILTVT